MRMISDINNYHNQIEQMKSHRIFYKFLLKIAWPDFSFQNIVTVTCEYFPSVDEEWKGLTNALAGLLCASLNFVDISNSMSPEFTFRPTGVMDGSINSNYLRYSSLPREIVCTENLTPFKKLLPCDSKVLINFPYYYSYYYISIIYL
jgi:hypothetical protein